MSRLFCRMVKASPFLLSAVDFPSPRNHLLCRNTKFLAFHPPKLFRFQLRWRSKPLQPPPRMFVSMESTASSAAVGRITSRQRFMRRSLAQMLGRTSRENCLKNYAGSTWRATNTIARSSTRRLHCQACAEHHPRFPISHLAHRTSRAANTTNLSARSV